MFLCPDGNLNFVPFADLSGNGQNFVMADFHAKALATGKGWETLAEVQRDWLVKLQNEKGMHRRRAGSRAVCNGRDGEPSQGGIGRETGAPTLTECQQTSKLSP